MPRQLCSKCLRPQNVCLCEYLVHLQAPCKVLILQHSSEQKQPLATVPILQLCLTPIQILVGEDFSDHPVAKDVLKGVNNVRVLFPTQQSAAWRVGQCLDKNEQVDLLIVLDGTWRKAKKMWFINDWLHQLPAVVLVGAPKSQYQIRSSTVSGGVSTLEAIAQSCNFLSNSTQFDALNVPFKAMIDMQIKKMGADVFQAHYQKTQD